MKPLKDYCHIKGFNYTASYAHNDIDFWSNYRAEVVEREMGYAQRLGLNSARIFLPYCVYRKNPQQFLEHVTEFVRVAWEHGISSTPIVFFGREFYPDYVEEDGSADMLVLENRHLSEEYFTALHGAIGSEPGLLFWDVSNEPGYHTPEFVTYYPDEPEFRHELSVKPEDMETFRAKQELVWAYLRDMIAYMRKIDPVNALGIGNTYAYEIEPSGTAELVDVLIYHDYFETRKRVRDICEQMKALSEKYQKPVINNETGCLARANPYDMELEILKEYGFGFYVFELMIGSSGWNRVHGICYPDGTVRDPSIVAAVQGFFRNRSETALPSDVNQEGAAYRAIDMAVRAISGAVNTHSGDHSGEAEELLEAAEMIANLLEAGEHVPMHYPPTAKVEAYRRQAHPNTEEIKDWLYELVETLKKACHIVGIGNTGSRI